MDEHYIDENGFIEDGSMPDEEYWKKKRNKEEIKWIFKSVCISFVIAFFIILPWLVGTIKIIQWIF